MSRREVEQGEQRWLKAFNGGDASGVAQIYKQDARLMPPNSDIVKGRSAIEKISREVTAAKLSYEHLDLASLASIADFARRMHARQHHRRQGRARQGRCSACCWPRNMRKSSSAQPAAA